MQKLEVFQSLWAMERRHPTLPEPSHAETFARIAAAGFDGVCLDPAISDLDEYRATLPFFEEHGLKSMVNLFPRRAREMRPLLDFALEARAVKVNTIAQVMPVSVVGAVPLFYRCWKRPRRWGSTSSSRPIGTGSSTISTSPGSPRCGPRTDADADLSHFVVDREFQLPLSRRDLGLLDRIHERSDCFQGRVATREQIQVQIDFPQHQPWVALFKSLWKAGLRSWRERNGPDATCVFLCELGPPNYAITDAQGLELSDRWAEVLTIRAWVREIWADLEAEIRSTPCS